MHNGQMSDSAVLGELRDGLAGVALPERPRVDAITARSRARRRHRLSGVAGVSVAGAAAAAALVLGLTGVPGSAPARGTIRTAAFTIVSNPDGTTSLTLHPDELFDPSTLQHDLARYGIPAMVTAGSFCSSDPAPGGFSQVVSFQPPFQGGGGQRHVTDPTVTINPAAMPSGTELSFGTFQLSTSQQTTIALIDTSSHTCTSTAPTTLPPGGALLRYPAGS